ncbi:MAG TPA: 4-hydroxy-tetrahydrodipicolinate reductase [Longimicrobiales bacterium]|nr:4-hydroxy-tetrahydrodipicolinate reductase [Longimicrobiales bacterium]
MTEIVVGGIRGRMGQALVHLAASHGLRVIAGLGRVAARGSDAEAYGCPRIVALSDAGAVADTLAAADVVLDFSNAAFTAELLARGAVALDGRALIVGTTGLEAEATRRLDDLSRSAAVLTAANFSIGVNLLVALAGRAAAVLDGGRFDVEIVEHHHGRKVDAPSGTALALGGAVADGRGQALGDVRRDGRSGQTGPRPQDEIGFHAVRGGGVVGEHRVLFIGEHERVVLGHDALHRAVFADGALAAARWLAGRGPGRYGMMEVLGL